MNASNNPQIQTEVESFVAKIKGLVYEEMLSALSGAANGQPSRKATVVRMTKRSVTGRTGQKRDPEALAALIGKTGEYINANPGQGVEQIGAALNTGTAALALPIKKLLASKVITRKGQKRATKYFPKKAA
jgi:hypothetical protein